MMLDVSEKIQEKIKLLEAMQVEIKKRAEDKSIKNAEYEKKLAITIIKLKNGEAMTIENETIQNPQATIIEKIARGICWQEKLEADKSEAMYKALISNIDCTMATLNGWQSINRYLDKT